MTGLQAGALAGLMVLQGATARADSAADWFARSRAAYAHLHSYSDAGSVVEEYGPARASLHEHHSFRTDYRAPRRFHFDFTKQGGQDRFVVWSDDGAFHTWWQATGVQQSYPKGQGASAFATGTVPTHGALVQIAPLLFANAGLTGTLTEFGDATDAGLENVAGRPCHKLTGVARSVYRATGHVTNVRRTTVWIDVETLLVRKVFEDTPEGTAAGWVQRRTTTFEPVANPPLGNDEFLFSPPTR